MVPKVYTRLLTSRTVKVMTLLFFTIFSKLIVSSCDELHATYSFLITDFFPSTKTRWQPKDREQRIL